MQGLQFPQFDDEENYTVLVDTADDKNPTLTSDGINETQLPDEDVSSQYHIGVLCGCDSDDVHIPTLADVFDYINQDRLFACDDDNELTINEEIPAYLGMVLSENEDTTDNNNDGPEPFDPNNPINVFTSALYHLAIALKPLELNAENWFETVDVEFEICGLWDATAYQALFVLPGARGINNCLSTHDCQTIFAKTLVMLNNFITDIILGQDLTQPVRFIGLPPDEKALIGLTNVECDLYTVLVTLATKMQRQLPYHWANRNFDKAKKIGLISWYTMGLSIEIGTWDDMVEWLGSTNAT